MPNPLHYEGCPRCEQPRQLAALTLWSGSNRFRLSLFCTACGTRCSGH